MKDTPPTSEQFERLLKWLHHDRDEAATEYEAIRRRLIKMFSSRGCSQAERAADVTFDRVAGKLSDLDYGVDDPRAPYVYRVASYVLMECLRVEKPTPLPPPPPEPDPDKEVILGCLDKCMESQLPGNRDIVQTYYEQEKRAKIDRRRKLAEELGITLNALRIKAFRIRAALQECVENCMQQQNNEMA